MLLWQAGGFDLQNQSDVLSIYSKSPLKAAFYDKLAKVNFLNDEHLAVINGTNVDGLEGYRMLFLPNVTVAKVQQEVIITQLESSYDFGDSPNWIKELIASYLTGTVFGSEKTKEMAATITAQMTDKQLENWNERLQAPSQIQNIEEVETQEVTQFTPYVLTDMNYEQSAVNEPLNVFTFEQIVGYIETSVEKSIVLIAQKADVLNVAEVSHENL